MTTSGKTMTHYRNQETYPLAVVAVILTLGHPPLLQVHALNMLKRLFQGSALGNDVLQYVTEGTQLAITSFSSPSWAVRNAATQLMGKFISVTDVATFGQTSFS